MLFTAHAGQQAMEADMQEIISSAETNRDSNALGEKYKQIFDSIQAKCKEKAKELKDKYSKKRTLDPSGDTAPQTPKERGSQKQP